MILDDHGLGEHDHAMIFIWIGLCSVLGIIWFLNDLRQRHIRQRKAISWFFLQNLCFKKSPEFLWDLGMTQVTYGDLGMMKLLNLWHDITAVQKNSNSNQA